MGCSSDATCATPRPSGSSRASFEIATTAGRIGALALACAALAACSAHERRTAAETTPAPVSAATAPVPDSAAQQDAAAQQAEPGAKAVVVASSMKAVQTSGKIGKAGGGLASWYGDRFHGRATANGERFNMASISAAHRSFPLPSYVRVTNVSNGRSIVVRVNDRGPFHGDRVIDVSRRTADILGFRGHGVGNVKLDYLGMAPAASDDGRLLASYQELGRPSMPPGIQMASLKPVSDAELAGDATAQGGAYAIASRAVTRSATYVMASASSAAATVGSAADATLGAARQAVRRVAPAKPSQAEPAQPAAAYAPPQPLLASVPPAIVSGETGKRVVTPSAPALASAAPVLRPSLSGAEVSSRIASSFDSFGPSATTVSTGGSVSAEATR